MISLELAIALAPFPLALASGVSVCLIVKKRVHAKTPPPDRFFSFAGFYSVACFLSLVVFMKISNWLDCKMEMAASGYGECIPDDGPQLVFLILNLIPGFIVTAILTFLPLYFLWLRKSAPWAASEK